MSLAALPPARPVKALAKLVVMERRFPGGATMPATLIKGTAFLNRSDFITERFGDDGLRRVRAKLTEAQARLLDFPNAAEWYPIETVLEVDQVIVSELLGGDATRFAEVGAFSLQRNLTGIYRFLFQVLSTQTMLQVGVSAFKKSVSQGSPVFEQRGPGDVVVRYVGFNPQKESYCHFLRGAIGGVLGVCGAKDGTVEKVECALKGQSACAFRVRWR